MIFLFPILLNGDVNHHSKGSTSPPSPTLSPPRLAHRRPSLPSLNFCVFLEDTIWLQLKHVMGDKNLLIDVWIEVNELGTKG
jgi:hypothetical protein